MGESCAPRNRGGYSRALDANEQRTSRCKEASKLTVTSARVKSAANALPVVLLLAALPVCAAAQTQPAPKLEGKEVKVYTLSPERYQQAVAFNRAVNRLYFLGFIYGVLIYLFVLRSRLAPRYRDWAEHASSCRSVQAIVYALLLLLTLRALALPRSAYSHWLHRKFGLSVQGWGAWAWDWGKSQLLFVVFGAIVVWILYGVIRRSPRRWWFYFWLALLPIILVVVFAEPVVIEPLFFRFEPLAARHPQLVVQIERVVERSGLRIPPERIFEMKASEKYTAVNAYVTGLGASKRVVVWDTTLEKLNQAQTLTVFGHELGHYVLGHISQGIVFAAAALFVFLRASFGLMAAALRRWGARWAVRGVDDWASLPVLLLLFSVFNFLGAPIENTFGRHIEHQADLYSLEVTHGIVPEAGEAAAQSFQVLGEINLEDPAPSQFIKVWLYDHPPLQDRITFAQSYDPWSKGQRPKYVPAP